MPDPFRVLLIKPRHNENTGHAVPPLGVMSLAAYVRRRPDVDVRIIDMSPWPMTYADLDFQIRRYAPDLVGISAITFEANGFCRAARLAKRWRADVPVVAGGPHATSYTNIILEDENVDIAAIGEGEETLDELIDALRRGGPLDQVAGIAFRRHGKIVRTPPRQPIADLDALPIPAWDLVPIRRYKRFNRFSKTGSLDYGLLFTSRGCPYGCVYCHQIFGKRFRARSAENVFNEIKTLYTEHGLREFEVIDDIFNLDRRRLHAICDLIIGSGMKISLTFPNGVRGDLLDEAQIRKLRKAGATFMAFPVETASPRLQKLIHKNVDLPRIRENIDLALEAGIFCQGFFIVGFPTETREEVQATFDFAIQSDLHVAHLFVANAFEGTALAELAKGLGKPVKRDFRQSYLTRGFDNLTDIPNEEFNRMRSRALRRFWLSPRRMWRIVRDYPNKQNLPGFLPAFLKRVSLYGQGH